MSKFVYLLSTEVAHITKRIYNHVIKRNNYRELNKKRQTSGHRVEVLLRIQLLYLLIHFHLRRLVCSARILFAYSTLHGTELSLFYLVLLLLDAKRKKNNLNDKREQTQRNHIVSADKIAELHNVSKRYCDNIKNSHLSFLVYGKRERFPAFHLSCPPNAELIL